MSRQIFLHKIIDDMALELPLKIHNIIGNAYRLRDATCVINGRKATAASVRRLVLLCLVLPDLHRNTDDIIALFLQKVCRHGGIHSP